eukprot:gene31811-7013_t
MSDSYQGSQQGDIPTNILMEKRARKIAEEDAARLYNRVRQLQKEEEKAGKRISETKKKAREIIKLRERNELVRQEKEDRMRELNELIEIQREENNRMKEEALKNKIEQENKVYLEKVNVVQQTKEEKAEIDKLLAESKLLSRKEALEQKESIRQQQEVARRKLEALKAQDDYEKRLKEETDAKNVKEAEIQRLAQIEMELIERLKTKQGQQQKAYQQLEAVLSLGGSTGSKSSSHGAPAAASAAPSAEPGEDDVARAFSVFDLDGTGEISALDMQGLMEDLGVPLNALQVSQAIAQLDPKQTGKITFGEFLL